MKIGIIGIGIINMEYAHRAAKLGYEVLISHTKETNCWKEVIENMGANVKLVDIYDAAIAEIILLSVDWEDLESSISHLPDMSKKLILHTNNPIFNFECSTSSLPIIIEKSSAEKIASLLPDAHVVKIFNKLQPSTIYGKNKEKNYGETDFFYMVKDQNVQNKVISFLSALDFSSLALTTVIKIDSRN
ncbi:NAD(P)-binding domain-containing protein [Flavobacterium sp. CLA17]|uniref:NAD(P)-binding domain-containing protein n=1 Tax=Flavobacterium sp. CLA17 TaxID=2724135 RepID=UPI0014912E7F|nr:NAD(P)-binding domain-containing protein [Flavobacterium sp. CLA17]QSB28796.1 NAD(P)-binding domain-containing protein [Flavobacterium sp. CLA17]